MNNAISRQLVRLIGMFVIGMVLTACGFHLRGTEHAQLSGKRIYIASKTPFGALEKSLRRELQSAGAMIADNSDSLQVQLVLGELEFEAQGASRDITGRANEVILRARITFQIIKPQVQGQAMDEPEKRLLKASRSYYQDYRNPISEQNLKKQAEQEIIDELAGLLSTQLAWTLDHP